MGCFSKRFQFHLKGFVQSGYWRNFTFDFKQLVNRHLGRPNRIFNRKDYVVRDFNKLADERQVFRILRNGQRPVAFVPRHEHTCDIRHSHHERIESLKQTHLRLTAERRLEYRDAKERSAGGSDEAIWSHIVDFDSESLETLLRDQSVPPGAIKACTEDILTTRIAVYGDWLLLTLPVSETWDAAHRTFVMFVCQQNRLLTISDNELTVLDNLIEQYTDGLRFHDSTMSAVLYQMLDFVIDEDMVFTIKTREELERVEELLDGDPHNFAVAASKLKRHMSGLTATFEDQLYVMRTLQTIESEAFSNDGLRDYLRDTITDLEHANRTLGRQETRLATAQQELQIREQSRTNSQLRILTIISTIFLPLTLITGIYGMNFRNMPEYSWRFGYAGVLLAMVTLTLLMLWSFNRKNWFK